MDMDVDARRMELESATATPTMDTDANTTTTKSGRFYDKNQDWKLKHPDPSIFFKSEWRCTSDVGYVIYRCLVALFAVHTVILMIVTDQHGKFAIFFTNWTYLMQTITFIYKAIVVIHCRTLANNVWRKQEVREDVRDASAPGMKWYLRLEWVLHTLTISVPMLVTIVFWALLFPKQKELHTTWLESYTNVQVHAFNSVLAVLELLTCAIPLRLLHFPYLWLFGISYALFSYVYYQAGGLSTHDRPAIYFFIDWRPGRAPISTLWCVGIGVLVTTMHLLAYGLKELQLRVLGRWRRRSAQHSGGSSSGATGGDGRRCRKGSRPNHGLQQNQNRHDVVRQYGSTGGIINLTMTLDEPEMKQHSDAFTFSPAS